MTYLILYFIIGVVISGLVRIYYYFPSQSLQNHPNYELLKETTWSDRTKNFLTGIIVWPMIVYGYFEEWLYSPLFLK